MNQQPWQMPQRWYNEMQVRMWWNMMHAASDSAYKPTDEEYNEDIKSVQAIRVVCGHLPYSWKWDNKSHKAQLPRAFTIHSLVTSEYFAHVKNLPNIVQEKYFVFHLPMGWGLLHLLQAVPSCMQYQISGIALFPYQNIAHPLPWPSCLFLHGA